MEITISNIGPIRSAAVKLAPLTVLIGPNNSGKSMVLTVLYSVMGQFGGYLPFEMTRLNRVRGVRFPDDDSGEIQNLISDWTTRLKKPDLDELLPSLRKLLEDYTAHGIRTYADLLVVELARSAGAEIAALRRANKGTSPSTISVTCEDPKWKVTIRLNAKGPVRDIELPTFSDVWENLEREGWRRFRNRVKRLGRSSPNQVVSDLAVELIRTCFNDFPRHTRYMPAARSGLMQSHKALSGSLIRRAAYAGIREMQIPAVSGIIADFLGEMIEVGPVGGGQFNAHATRLEDDILHGKIDLEEDVSGGGYPEPVYRSLGKSFPLGRTSSMVSELAPVVLYLRHLMQRGDLLMIEEPEAHLHPQAQVAFAKSIVRLVNDGLSIAMTTHSEFFLQQLNNAVIAARLNGSGVAGIDLDPETRIAARRVAAFICRPSENGTQVVSLDVDRRDGIPENSFSEVAEYLYDQNVALEKRVGDEPDA